MQTFILVTTVCCDIMILINVWIYIVQYNAF